MHAQPMPQPACCAAARHAPVHANSHRHHPPTPCLLQLQPDRRAALISYRGCHHPRQSSAAAAGAPPAGPPSRTAPAPHAAPRRRWCAARSAGCRAAGTIPSEGAVHIRPATAQAGEQAAAPLPDLGIPRPQRVLGGRRSTDHHLRRRGAGSRAAGSATSRAARAAAGRSAAARP
jgi:hypothetical protein